MISRGEVWWASFPAPRGSEPGFRRPVLVVQSDEFNRSRIATVIGVVLTSNMRLVDAPGNVLLKRRETGLPKDSVANVSQVITLDKSFFVDRVKSLPVARMQDVENGLRLVLSL